MNACATFPNGEWYLCFRFPSVRNDYLVNLKIFPYLLCWHHGAQHPLYDC